MIYKNCIKILFSGPITCEECNTLVASTLDTVLLAIHKNWKLLALR